MYDVHIFHPQILNDVVLLHPPQSQQQLPWLPHARVTLGTPPSPSPCPLSLIPSPPPLYFYFYSTTNSHFRLYFHISSHSTLVRFPDPLGKWVGRTNPSFMSVGNQTNSTPTCSCLSSTPQIMDGKLNSRSRMMHDTRMNKWTNR